MDKIAKRLEIHISTAFYWRHKILNALGGTRESMKGRKIMHRKAKKAEKIDTVIGAYIHPSALLCTDTATNYKKFAKIKGLQHETVNERQKQRVKKGIYHIQHVNNFHSRLKAWMERLQGAATKYLDNYLY